MPHQIVKNVHIQSREIINIENDKEYRQNLTHLTREFLSLQVTIEDWEFIDFISYVKGD